MKRAARFDLFSHVLSCGFGFFADLPGKRLRWLASIVLACGAYAASDFQAGAAKREITPQEPVPMWGYGARHDALSTGVLDPLYAAAIVIQVGQDKLAIVGLDLG